MRGRILLTAALAAATLAAATLVVAPATAWADGSGHFCDVNRLCMSMNGTEGDLVYGKPSVDDNQQKTRVEGIFACTRRGFPNEYVQWKGRRGDTENCPFSAPKWDKMYVTDEIVNIFNYQSGNLAQARTSASGVYQAGPAASGEEWVAAPGGSYVSVLATDHDGDPEQLCDSGRDNSLVLIFTLGSCVWSFGS